MDVLKLFSLLKKGSIEIISEKELLDLILKKKKINVKVGFDPTSTTLHLGHVVLLKKLKQFQEFGCRVAFIIGDFTARIGDPSGKNKSRIQLTKDTIINNYSTYKTQIFKFLKPSLTDVYFNSSWLANFNAEDFIKLMSFSTISKLIERSDFKYRYKNKKAISVHEFIYPLLQAYDSVFLNPDIEIGGIDQKFNLLLSRDIQRKYKKKPQIIIMMPILNGIDGMMKMSKTLNNCISITDKANDIFCKVMSISDQLMKDYFINLDFLSLLEYNRLSLYINPMNIKLNLAFRIVSLMYDKIIAKKSSEFFIDMFSRKVISTSIKDYIIYIKDSSISLFKILNKLKIIKSNSDFKRLLKYNSISINKILIKDKNFSLFVNEKKFIKIGKKIFFNILLKNEKKSV